MRGWWSLLIAVLGAVALAILMTTPPSPRNRDTPATDFSAVRAMIDIDAIARAPHPTGSAENARVRGLLVARLRGMGLSVRTAAYPMDAVGAAHLAKWSGVPVAPPVTDIIATLPGRDRAKPAVLLMAHYDTVWGSPGAADDSAGIASALEVTRALVEKGDRARDLIVLFTDGEELGLEGAKAFFALDPDRGRVGVVVNLETRGGGGRAQMFETGAQNGEMMRLFGRAVRHPAATSLSVLIYNLLPNSTDFTPAKAAGLPGFNFAFIGRPSLYHSPLATPERVDAGAVQDMGGQALDLVRALVAVDALPGQAADWVFFDAFSFTLVSYSSAFGVIVLVLAAFGYLAAAWRANRARRWLGQSVGVVAFTFVAAGALYAINLLSEDKNRHNYYNRLAEISWLQVQMLLVCAAVAVCFVALFRRTEQPSRDAAAMALPLLLLGAVAQFFAPTAAFLINVPLLLGAIAALEIAYARPPNGIFSAVLAASIGGGWLLGLSFEFIQAIGATLPPVIALPVALIVVLFWPLVPPVDRRHAFAVAGALVLAGVTIAISLRLAPLSPSVPAYSLKP